MTSHFLLQAPFWREAGLTVGLILVSYAAYWFSRLLYRWVYQTLLQGRTSGAWAIVLGSHIVPRVLQTVPLIVAGVLTHLLLAEGLWQELLMVLNRAYFIYLCANVFSAAMTLTYRLTNYRRGVEASPQKGIFQVLSLMGYGFAAVAIVATLSGRDPTYILSCMTALSAVFMLVFKDSILGLTAGITLAGNGMVKIGDWIEVPGSDADGDVIDIALTTVRVQNWDKTITTIPAYDLISKPFKNWRGMSESGGRRVKRAIVLDLDSVRFADEAQLAHWSTIDHLRDYLSAKRAEVAAYNASHPTAHQSPANSRRLTNLGTYRAYCLAYLRAHPEIRQDMTLLVRQLPPTDRGLPLELYCFTRSTEWSTYERVQSDLFDHLLAILPEFGLTPFQVTSADALRVGLKGR